MALINGDDFVSGSVDSYQQNNRMKNHWRLNIADLTNPSEGMIKSTPVTNLLEHCQVDSSPGPIVWEEIVQTNTPISDDKQIIGGDGSDTILIPYEETTNDAVLWGLPVDPKRGLIFCDVADIAGNFAALITASTHPMVSIVDLDLDSYLSFGYAGNNLPDIWSNRTLNLQYEAIAGVNFFAGAESGENPYIYVYGWETGRGARQYTRFQMSDNNNEFIIESENNGDHEGITISLTEAGQRFRLRQNGDILSWYLDGTDAFMRWSEGQLEFQTDEVDATTVLRILPNGTSEVSQLDFYDTGAIRLSLYTAADRGYIESVGGDLGINPNAEHDVKYFEDCVDGENPFIYIYGYDTGAVAQRRGSLQVTNAGSFEIDAQEAGALAQGGTVVIRWYSDRVVWLDGRLAEFGSTNDASIEYDEATNDAWIFGVPVHPKRGLIFCARGDIADNFTGLITAHAQPTVFWSDLDIDSYLAIGHSADDKPDIYSNNILNLQYEAIAGVDLFANASSGENQELRIFGFRGGDALKSLEIGVGVDAADTASFDGVSNYDFNGNITCTKLGVNAAIPPLGQCQISNLAINTTQSFYGNRFFFAKTAGATDAADVFYGSYVYAELDQAGGTVGNLYGELVYARIIDGNVGDVGNLRYLAGLICNADLDGGKIWGNAIALWAKVDQEGANEITGDGYGVLIDIDADGTVGGNMYMLYLNENSNVDYGIYQNGTAINYLGGNTGIGQATFGTNATKTIALGSGVAPITSPADCFQMWSMDVLGIAGKAGPHWRSEENGMYAWHGGAGTINSFTYQADVADDASFTLPAITDSAWGFIQAGDNDEYALFTVDDDGDVTLISNSANVVANADIDGKICLGLAAATEPVEIRNRLNATKNINLIIWYS